MIRHITTTTKRARAFCKTLPGKQIRWSEPYLWHYGYRRYRVSARDIAESTGDLESVLRYVDCDVDISQLSPLARELAEYGHPRNHKRNNDYMIICNRLCADVEQWSQQNRKAFSQIGTQHYTTALHWPILFENESAEHYYERVARIVQLVRYLIDDLCLTPTIAKSFISKIERWENEWSFVRAQDWIDIKLGGKN